jgi:translocation and assembly module TamA
LAHRSTTPRPGIRRSLRAVGMGCALLTLMLASTVANGAPVPQLRVSGADAEQEQNLRAYIVLERESCTPTRLRERRLLRDADTQAAQALRALGYYAPHIEARIVHGADCWELLVTVDPGPRAQISRVDLQLRGEGLEDPILAAILADPGLAAGDPVRHDQYDRLRSRLLRAAADRGFLDASLDRSELRVDPAAGSAEVILHLDSGPRYRFGPITLEQSFLDPRFVERLFPFAEGDPYSSSQLIALQRRLADSGYFEAVRVRPQLDRVSSLAVPVLAEVSPRPRTAYELRLGASTDTGPRFGASLERRYANRRGHRYGAELDASARRSGMGFHYEIPLRDPLRDALRLSGSLLTEDTGSSRSDRAQVGVNRIQHQPSGWQVTQGLRYEYEDYTVAGVSDITRLLIPSYRLYRVRADDPVSPRSGYRIDLLGQGAARSLASSTDFVQGRAGAKWIEGLGQGRLLLRGEAGVTVSDSLQDLPGSLRFFAGGDTSVRGFGYQKLGPKDAEGRVTGGRHLLVGSVEYDHPLGESAWGLAVFLDAGNAFDRFDDYRLKGGGGVGLRWRSPVGPLRLDLAHAPDSDDSFRIHFTLGPDL